MSDAFARTVRVFAAGNLSPQGLSRLLATTARQERDEAIRTGAAPQTYTTFVDGIEGASEDAVRPSGVIHYQFNDWDEVVTFGLTYVTLRSPRDSGAYRDAWELAVDGRPWGRDFGDIPPRSIVTLVNPMPYARKVDVGAMPGMRAPPGIVEGARQAMARRFPHYQFDRIFVHLPPSFGAGLPIDVPYILRGRQRGRRKVLMAGEPITYPTLQMRRRG